MKYKFLRMSALFFILILLVNFSPTYAGFFNPFGGKIILAKAIEIQLDEALGYSCIVIGKTITIYPKGPPGIPTSYFIPVSVPSKTNTTPSVGQEIKGFYLSMKTPITCIRYYPYSIKTENLSTISMYGTSKF